MTRLLTAAENFLSMLRDPSVEKGDYEWNYYLAELESAVKETRALRGDYKTLTHQLTTLQEEAKKIQAELHTIRDTVEEQDQ